MFLRWWSAGAVYSSGVIYALQPWVQESQPFSETFQRSLEMVGYRFRRNLLIWGLTALLLAAVGLTVTVTIGLLLPLPLSACAGWASRRSCRRSLPSHG